MQKAKILAFNDARAHRMGPNSSIQERSMRAQGSYSANPFPARKQAPLSYGLSDDFFNESEDFGRNFENTFRRHSGRQTAQKPSRRQRNGGSPIDVNPRAALSVFDPEEERRENPNRNSKTKSRKQLREDKKKEKLKRKAEKSFNKQFTQNADASQEGSRPAVYKGEMGSKHKQAIRKQNDAQERSFSGFGSVPAAFFSFLAKAFSTPKRIFISSIAFCLIFGCAFLYGPTKEYYQTIREHARLDVERQIVMDKAKDLTAKKEFLQTDEGVKRAAHSEYGWVEQGENAVTVYGLQADPMNKTNATNTKSADIDPPATWYSPVLDAFFDVE